MFPRLDRYATLYLARPLISIAGNGSSHNLPILMYHSISDTSEESLQPYYRVCTSPHAFETQLASLAERGFKTFDLLEAGEKLASGADLSKRFVITFDDGFRDFHTAAFPILKRYRFTATMFVPTAFIGDERRSFKDRECLTWQEIRELRAAGMQFGSHTVNHPKLVELPFSEIRNELQNSRNTLEDKLQEPVRTFAYPYAFPQEDCKFTDRFRNELQAAGYETAVTTMIGRVSRGDDRFTLKRLPTNDCDDPRLLSAKVQGAYDWLGAFQSMWKTLKRWIRR